MKIGILTLHDSVNYGALAQTYALRSRISALGHDAVVGDFVNMGPGTVVAGGAKVGSGVSFYANSSTMPRVTIGDNAVVSAGASVKEDLAAGASV